MTAQFPSINEKIYRLANHIAGAKGGLPTEWQDWAEEIETDLRALLAAHEQEPVAYMYRDNLHTDARFSLEPRFSNWSPEDINEYEISETPLYTHPAPVPAVPEERTFLFYCEKYPEMPMGDAIIRAVEWNACRAAMLGGNHRDLSYPVDPQVAEYEKIMQQAVHDGYVLVPVDATMDMLKAGSKQEMKGESFQSVWKAMIAAAPTAPGSQLTQEPEDRLQKAIIDACIVFLHGCDSRSKNYECDFSDSETELYFCIANVAKKIGVVEETGNRRWSISQQMRDEINDVYRKYAMRIMEAAPKVTP